MSFPLSQLLRLAVLLLMPLWLSLTVDSLGLVQSFPTTISSWRRASTDPSSATLVPPSGWRESRYLAANPDVAAAVRDGQIANGYTHYVQFGRAEGRNIGLPPAGFAAPVAPPSSPPVPALAALPTPTAPAPGEAHPKAQTDPSRESTPPARKPTVPPQAAAPQPAPEPVGELPAVKPTPPPADPPAAARNGSAGGGQVFRIRTAHSDSGVRVVLDIDQPLQINALRSRADGQLMVPLVGTRWLAAPAGPLFPSAVTYRIERKGEDIQLLFSAAGAKKTVQLAGSSILPPDKERGHRLVLDLVLQPATKARE
ncbi:hypothetical protein M5E06_31915 [Azospirillum sp. A1-3]|uniref:hypothetical protein n=1 Tax=Azospirillum sp. A1-3 TaxID=185874 RepID=UPI0020770B53|nr:hypothetical protein [Azospirillum sp. A1-3]MCM8738710.1 hypothetical protein [Azospirillum sp. A1-3]